MLGERVYSKRYVRIMWKRNPFMMANKAHCYPCCDVPTDEKCRMCAEDVHCLLRRESNKRGIVVGSSGFGPGRFDHLYFQAMAGIAMADAPFLFHGGGRRMGMSYLNDLIRTKRRPEKTCQLPGCDNTTTHRGGYCCSVHCRQHQIQQGKKIKAVGR